MNITPADNMEIGKILIIKLRGIGDVILSTVLLDNLKNQFPNAQIDFLTEKPSVPVLEELPHLNKVIQFNKGNTFQRIKQIFEIRSAGYDMVIDLFSNPATALISFFSGASYRIGFPYRGRKYAYNIHGPADRNKYHAADLHLELIKAAGIKVRSKVLYTGLTNNDFSFADDFFKKADLQSYFTVGIIPGGGWPSKKCDPEKFAEIADKLVEEFSARILILWGPGDLEDAKSIQSQMGSKSVLATETTFRQMGALIANCDLVIANDSGPMHLSTAIGTPVLGLFGPTDPQLQGPYGEKHEWIRLEELDCIGCNLLECPRNHECFTDLPVGKVLEKVKLLLHKNNIII